MDTDCNQCRHLNTDNCWWDQEAPGKCTGFSKRNILKADEISITIEDKKLCNFRIMRNMRERFGEKPYNSEKLFPDPRIKQTGRRLRRY